MHVCMYEPSMYIIILDVPGPINHDLVENRVVDLLRVNVTWPLPIDNNAPITSYLFTYCSGNIESSTCVISSNQNITRGVDEVEVREGNVTTTLPFPVNRMIELNITAINSIGLGMSLNAPFRLTTATPSE